MHPIFRSRDPKDHVSFCHHFPSSSVRPPLLEYLHLSNQTQELPVAAMFVKDLGKMCNLQGGPSIDASYQATFHLTKQFQRRRYFRNQPIRNKNCLWRPCLLTDRDNIRQIQRGPFIDASYKSYYLFGLAVSEENIFQKSIDQKQ